MCNIITHYHYQNLISFYNTLQRAHINLNVLRLPGFYLHISRPGLAQWLRRCATSRTVPGSIPGGVTGFFSDISPSDRSIALGLTQPLVNMSTRNIPGGKGDRCVRLTTSPPLRAECHEIWEPKPPGTLWVTPGLLRDSFTYISQVFSAIYTATCFDTFMSSGSYKQCLSFLLSQNKQRLVPLTTSTDWFL